MVVSVVLHALRSLLAASVTSCKRVKGAAHAVFSLVISQGEAGASPPCMTVAHHLECKGILAPCTHAMAGCCTGGMVAAAPLTRRRCRLLICTGGLLGVTTTAWAIERRYPPMPPTQLPPHVK